MTPSLGKVIEIGHYYEDAGSSSGSPNPDSGLK